MTKISVNAGKKIVFVLKNILGKEIATIETTTSRATLAEKLSGFDWGERFMKYVGEQDEATGCLPWTGGRTQDGYGRIKYQGKTRGAHRLVYGALKGDTLNLLVMHLCNNSPCVNPDHLKAGTTEENLAYRNLCGNYYGAKNGACKLTTEQVSRIRALAGEGQISQEKIAKMFGISQTHVCSLKAGESRNFI